MSMKKILIRRKKKKRQIFPPDFFDSLAEAQRKLPPFSAHSRVPLEL